MADSLKIKCKMIAKYYGSSHQAVKAIEEMAELQKELAKYALNDNYNMKNIIEELADVCIMIEQLKYCMIPADVDLNDIIWEKLDRQLKRMEDENNG